jgi:hypothetical protein
MKFIRPLLGCALRFLSAPAGCATQSTRPQSGSGGSSGTAGTVGGLRGGDLGFLANGSDVAMFDIEVVDANGQRVPPTRPGWTSR